MTWRKAGLRLALLLLYAGLAVLFTYPLAWHLGTHHVGEAGGDARIYLWNFWWVKKAVLELQTNPFWTDYIFYPLGIGLSLHTLGFLQGLLLIPLSALWGEVVATNLILVGTFVASALGAYALARYLGAGGPGALLAGIVFAFCPYRLARLAGHYDLLSTEWLPFYALVFLKAMERENRRWPLLLGAGALAAACGYTALSYLVFLAIFTLTYIAWKLWREAFRIASLLGRSAIIGLITSALLSPLLLQTYRDVTSWRYVPYPGFERYAADLLAYFLPGPGQTLLGQTLGRGFDRNLTETTVFPGYLALALSAAAVGSASLRRSHGFWMGAGLLSFLLSLGGTLKVAGHQSGFPLPYALFQKMPLLEHLRAPSRISILLILAMAVLLAARWTEWLGRIRSRAAAILLTAAAGAFLAAEYLAIPIPLFRAGVPPLYRRLAAEPGDFTVVEIPGIDQAAGQIMHHQTVHQKRILIGTASRVPLEKTAYFFGLPLIRPLVDLRKGKLPLSRELIDRERELAPRVARFLNIRYLVIERAFARRGILEFLEQVLPVEPVYEDAERIALRVRQEELPLLPWSIDPASGDSRLHFESGWSRPEEGEGQRFRWADRIPSTILFRRPAGEPLELVLVLSPLEGIAEQAVEGRLEGERLGKVVLSAGWSEVRWALPPGPAALVERLELEWARLSRASDRDPRLLAARLAGFRFERMPGQSSR